MKSDEQKVRERWPYARIRSFGKYGYVVLESPVWYGPWISDFRPTESDAWADAARRLEKRNEGHNNE